MRWTFLGIAVSAFGLFWNAGVEYVLFIAFGVMFANFASFCLLYDRPKERARNRVREQLRHLHPNTDTAQRLSTAVITPTAADRQLGIGPMTLLNFVSGLAAVVLLMWALVIMFM